MDTTVITAMITAATTLIVSMGTWQVTMKQARKKDQDELKALIESYRTELHTRLETLQAEVTDIKTSVDKQVSLIEYKIDGLSKSVERHNGVIERTYSLENRADVLDEKIRVANHRIEDIEKMKGG